MTSHNKTGIHQLSLNSLIEFLRTDLDRNLVPSSLDLTSHNKAGLHQTFQKYLVEFLGTDFLIEFLCTDLDGNLSFALNPLTASKLDHFLLTLLEGLKVGGPQEKMSFFQIASGPILSIPIHSNTCQYDPDKVLLKKMTPFLPMNPPKLAFFGSSDRASD